MLTYGLIAAFTILSLSLLAYGLARPGRYYEFPFLATATFVFFILPQVFGLADDRHLPRGALDKALVFAILCLVGCWLGWRSRPPSVQLLNWELSERRLLQAAALLSIIGAYFFYKISRLPEAERLATMKTGAAVAYLFFARLVTYGFAVAVLCWFRRPSLPALALILFDSFFFFDRIVIAGRRGDAAEFVFIIVLAMWFQQRRAVPRTVALIGVAVSFIAMQAVGDYRNAVVYSEKPDWSNVARIDVAGNINGMLDEGGLEFRNAATMIDHADTTQQFDFGLSHWNTLVLTYVPGQILGQSVKRALLIEPIGPYSDLRYTASIGSTYTGLADAFASFWYLGFIKYVLIAYLMSRIYAAAMSGNAAMQILYMLSASAAMHTITHFTQWILSAWIHIALFMLPVAVFAAIRSRPAVHACRATAGRLARGARRTAH